MDISHCETLGNAFVAQYYKLFDLKDTRAQVASLYHPVESGLSFEGQRYQGAQNIMAKYVEMPFENLYRQLTTVDVQVINMGQAPPNVLIQVLGQLRTDSENDKVMPFTQTFLLKNYDGNFFLSNDIFRLVLHDVSG